MPSEVKRLRQLKEENGKLSCCRFGGQAVRLT
jgi:hypothetical protein